MGRRVLRKSNPRAREAHGQSAMGNTEEEVMVSASEVRKTFLEEMTLGQLREEWLSDGKGVRGVFQLKKQSITKINVVKGYHSFRDG